MVEQRDGYSSAPLCRLRSLVCMAEPGGVGEARMSSQPIGMPDWQPWWIRSNRADPRSVKIADRHYNRQKIGTPQFVPPGRCVVFRHEDDALWVTSWPFAQYVKHAWAGAWVNSCFRNESDRLSSELITEAVLATRLVWEPPPLGIVSFVDSSKIKHKRDPGRCYRRAGWTHVGFTKGGLYAFQQKPEDMP